MSIWEALVLGIVQGITEFLPVSSSGHLVLLQKIFGITEPVMLFDTAVHGGTLVAVLVVLRQDILNILRRIFQPLTLFIIAGTIPIVIAGLLFKDHIENAFTSGTFLCFAFLITSALLFLSEKFFRRSQAVGFLDRLEEGPPSEKFQDNMTIPDALFIGIFQAVAILPGISRSGATISAGLFRGLNRDFAARFSFILSIPAILGALVLQVMDLFKTDALHGAGNPGGVGLLPMAVGVISAAIAGFFSIRITLKIVKERSLFGFALYTGILGVLVLIDRFWTNFFF